MSYYTDLGRKAYQVAGDDRVVPVTVATMGGETGAKEWLAGWDEAQAEECHPPRSFTVEIARQELQSQGWTIVPDEPSVRARVTQEFTGRYVSYWDPDLQAVLVVLHSRLRKALGV